MARILIIDDDEQIRQMLRQMLERSGYEVADACDGESGLKRFRENPADLIITDIIMPEKEGIETIRELVREYPAVKIIAMSGGGRVGPDAYLKMAKCVGAVHTFIKPIEKSELLKVIDDILNNSG